MLVLSPSLPHLLFAPSNFLRLLATFLALDLGSLFQIPAVSLPFVWCHGGQIIGEAVHLPNTPPSELSAHVAQVQQGDLCPRDTGEPLSPFGTKVSIRRSPTACHPETFPELPCHTRIPAGQRFPIFLQINSLFSL